MANTSYRVNSGLNDRLVDGRHIVRNIELTDLRLAASNKSWMSRSGVYGGHFERLSVLDSPVGFGFNALGHTTVRNVHGVFYSCILEAAFLSHDITVGDFEFNWSDRGNDLGDPPETPISIGENSRGMEFREGRLNLGQMSVSGPLATISSLNRNRLSDIRFHGNAVFQSVLTDSGEANRFERLTFDWGTPSGFWVNLAGADTVLDACQFHSDNPAVTVRLQSSVTCGRISGNHWTSDGAVQTEAGSAGPVFFSSNHGLSSFDAEAMKGQVVARDNNSSLWARLQNFAISSTTGGGLTIASATETLVGSALVVPAGTLEIGDRYRMVVTAGCTGSAGDRFIRVNFPVDTDTDGAALDAGDDTNQAALFTIPATCPDICMEVSFTIQSLTQLRTYVRMIQVDSGESTGQVIRHTSVDMADKPLRLEVSAWVASTADRIIFRDFQRELKRFGMV